jgi:PhoH-like ATPase
MEKYFVLDTNVLLHNPDSLFSFMEHTVVVPIFVIEELDNFKRFTDKKGKHARHVLRYIDKVLHKGLLKNGAKLKSGGKLIVPLEVDMTELPSLNPNLVDNKILNVAWRLKESGKHVIFISKDINARIKGEALGIHTCDFDKQKASYEDLYRGWREIVITKEEIDLFSASHELDLSRETLQPNECVWLHNKKLSTASFIACFDVETGLVKKIKEPIDAMGITPLNMEQQFACQLLMDDSIKLVSLVGVAGSGKTLLALACGLEKILGQKQRYEKLLVARPVIPMGKDIGFLPGSKDEKMSYWMQPIFDNMKFILDKDTGIDMRNRKQQQIDYLLDSGVVEVEALTYIRGRSIPNQFIIIDEAQNLTPHEVKTIISRIGKGSKIVLTGDPDQIDNPYLDSNSNGLTYTAEMLKEKEIVGHILLSKSERSELASIAAETL